MEYLSLFITSSASVKFKRKLQSQAIPVELLPVPRLLSSRCGVAAKFTWENDINVLLHQGVERLYQIDGDNYILVYQAK